MILPERNACQTNATDHNPISSRISIFYPFHPLHGMKFEVISKKERRDGTVRIRAPHSYCCEIPLWMTDELATGYEITKSSEISMKALFSLIELLECSIENVRF